MKHEHEKLPILFIFSPLTCMNTEWDHLFDLFTRFGPDSTIAYWLSSKEFVGTEIGVTTVFFTLDGKMTQKHYGQTQNQTNIQERVTCVETGQATTSIYNYIFVSFQ